MIIWTAFAYEDTKIDEYMCSRNCPCADVPEKEQWLALEDPPNRDLIENPWDFSGSIMNY